MFFHSTILQSSSAEDTSETMDWVSQKGFALRDRTWGQRVAAGNELMTFLLGQRKNIGAIHADFIQDLCKNQREAFEIGFMEPVFTQHVTAIRRLCVNLHKKLGKKPPQERKDVIQWINAIEARVIELANLEDKTLRTPSDESFAQVYSHLREINPYYYVMELMVQETCSRRLSPGHYQTLVRFCDGINNPIFSYSYMAARPLTHDAIQSIFDQGAWDWTHQAEIEEQYRKAQSTTCE
jgi:hypothetical protein